MRLAACLAGLISLAAPSFAFAASVRGTFVETAPKRPLAGVEVVVRNAADSTVAAHTVTDSTGRFQLDGLALGRYLLRASLLGHVPWQRGDLTLTEAAPTLDLGMQVLAVSPIAVKGVETSTARANAIVTSDRNIYLAKDLPAGTGTELLRQVPELDVDINDNVSLRGSSSVTIQINGRVSPLKGEALTNFLRQLPASRVERVEVIANPSAKFDPEGMAGIVNIVTKEPLDLGLSGSFFTTLGNRGGGPGGRIAWQRGKLTLSGGVNGYWNSYDYRYDNVRENRVADPPNSYRLGTAGHSRYGFGGTDGSFDYAFDKRNTLYGTLTGYLSAGRSDGRSGYVFLDDLLAVTSSFDRTNRGETGWRSGSGTLGFTRVIEKSRKEWTLEARANTSPSTNNTNAIQHLLVPVDSTGQVSVLDGDGDQRERSIQFDDTYPLGKKGKLESGYRGSERRNASTSVLDIVSGAAADARSEYVHREVFHSGYITLGSTFGRLSVQAGLRGEAANTTFEVVRVAARYPNDYRSLFPSGNAAWDFGSGRTLRLSYSKRIERPSPFFLNPDVPAIDSLDRSVGNPFLAPKYTHSLSLDASWAGSRGLLRVSPFYRRTVRNWDQFKTVEPSGVAITTWLNASSIRLVGVSLVASLRQVDRVGGTLNLSLYREDHDASNLAQHLQRTTTTGSLSGNVTIKASKKLDLQSFVRYNPAQTLAQGRVSGTLWSNLGARWKFTETAWASLYVNDPFDLWRYRYTTSDATYTQNSTSRGSQRQVSLSLGWSWGKPPETKQRKQTDDATPPEQMTPGR